MTTWYVQQGAGGGSGTLADPWQTFANVVWGAGGVVAGDTLTILGTYTSTGAADYMTIGDSGSAGSPITITGGTIDCNDTGNYGILSSSKSYITISGVTILDALQNGISFSGGSNIILTSDNVSGCAERGIQFDNTSTITLTSCVSSNNTKYGIFIEATNSVSTGVTITNCTANSNPFANLRLKGFKEGTEELSNITVTGGTYNSSTAAGNDGIGIWFNIIENLTIDGVTVSSNNLGIWTDNVPQNGDTGNFDNTNTIIRNCTLINNTHRAIYMFGHGHQILNNTITSPGLNSLTLVYSGGSDDDCYIQGNVFSGAGANEANITLNNGSHVDQARTVYCSGNSIPSGQFGILAGNSDSKAETLEIYTNKIIGCGNGVKVRNADNTQTINLDNNTLHDNTVGLQIGDNATDPTVTVTNCIITESANYIYYIEDVSAGQDITSDYNCFLGDTAASEFRRDLTLGSDDTMDFATWKTTTSQDGNSLRTDPFYVDKTTSDFHLSYNSPAANLGTDVGIATDFDGRDTRTPPDAGAYALYWLNNEKYGTTGYNDQYGTDHIGRDNNPKYEDDQNLVYSRLNNSAYED
jgi:hypothetical protein